MEIVSFSPLYSDNDSMSEKEKKNKKKTGLGLAIWILLFLIILIVFLVKQEEIKENFDKSGATALIEKKIGKEIFDEKKSSKKSEGSEEIIIDLTKKSKKNEESVKTEQPKKEERVKPEQVVEKETTVNTESKKTSVEPEPVKAEKQEKPVEVAKKTEEKKTILPVKQPEKPQAQTVVTPPSNTTKTKICFVAIDSDGLVLRKEVSRSVAKESPLSEALNELLKGPSASESKTGCQSYIPAGSKLLGISIKDGIATLNFNEEFQFNSYGSMGSNVQLMQIVYTATSFPTVKKVQFLIEGKKLDYLSEGVWVGSPRGRNDY